MSQHALCQSSVTGGGGGGDRKNIGVAEINFILIFGREEQNKLKGFHSGRLPSFGAQVSLGGDLHSPGERAVQPKVQISLLANKFKGEGKKKTGLPGKIFRSVLAFRSCFSSWNVFYPTLEGHFLLWRHGPEIPLVEPGL